MKANKLTSESRIRRSTIAQNPQDIAATVSRYCQTDTDGLDEWIGGTPITAERVTIKALAREWDALSAE